MEAKYSETATLQKAKDAWANTEPVSTDYCPAPIVSSVHPELVTVAEGEPSLLREVVSYDTIFLPQQNEISRIGRAVASVG